MNHITILLLFTPENLKRKYDKDYAAKNPETMKAAQRKYSSSPQRRAKRRKSK